MNMLLVILTIAIISILGIILNLFIRNDIKGLKSVFFVIVFMLFAGTMIWLALNSI